MAAEATSGTPRGRISALAWVSVAALASDRSLADAGTVGGVTSKVRRVRAAEVQGAPGAAVTPRLRLVHQPPDRSLSIAARDNASSCLAPSRPR